MPENLKRADLSNNVSRMGIVNTIPIKMETNKIFLFFSSNFKYKKNNETKISGETILKL